MRGSKRLFAIVLSILMVITIIPIDSISAIAATNNKIVKTSKEMNNVLKKQKVVSVNVNTKKRMVFATQKQKYVKKTLHIKAPRSTFKNKAVFKNINIKDIKSYIELGNGNRLNITDSKASIKIDKKAKKTAIILNRKNSKISLKINGTTTAIKLKKKGNLNISGKPKSEIQITNQGMNSQISINAVSRGTIVLNKNATVIIGKNVIEGKVDLSANSTGKIINHSKKTVIVKRSDGSSVEVKPGETKTVNGRSDSTEKEQNEKDKGIVPTKAYTVSFETNGGTPIAAQTVEEGKKVIKPEEPLWDGFSFKGWYTDASFKHSYDFNEKVSENFTLYAKWRVNDDSDTKHTVTFVLNDGTDGAYELQTVTNNKLAKQPLVDPSRKGYKFEGWYDDETMTNKYDFSTPVTGNITLYAGWGNPETSDGLYSSQSGGGTTYSVSSLKINGNKVETVVNVNSPSILVVRFYNAEGYFDDSNNWSTDTATNYGNLAVRTPAYCEGTTISLDMNSNINLPEHYIVTASLYDSETLNSLCETYICADYTEENEKFEKLTVNDFNRANVVNFDRNVADNFGVLEDGIKKIYCTDTTNILSVRNKDVTEIDKSDTYTFSNPDSEVKALKQGDKILIYENGTAKDLLKIAYVSKNENGAVSVTESLDVELTDFYSVLKVNMNVEDNADSKAGIARYAEVIDSEVSGKAALKVDFEKKLAENLKVHVAGNGEVKLTIKIKYDVRLFRKDYLECSVTPNLTGTVSMELEGKVDNSKKVKDELDGVKVEVPTSIAGLKVYTALTFPTEVALKSSGTLTLKYDIKRGFEYNTNSGRQDIDEKTYSVDFKGDAQFEIASGPKATVGTSFLGETLDASVEAQIGAKVTAETSSEAGTSDKERHACRVCLSGKARWFAKGAVKLEYHIVNKLLDGVAFDLTVLDVEGYLNVAGTHPGTFYLSLNNEKDSIFGGKIKFGWDECTNKKYRTIVKVLDDDGNEIPGIALTIAKQNGDIVKTGKSQLQMFLYDGVYKVSGKINNKLVSSAFVINKGEKTIQLSEKSNATTPITGNVRDALTQNWISGANISFKKGNMVIATVDSEANGKFSADLPADSYEIIISKNNYSSVAINETIVENETKYLGTIDLVPGDENGQGGFSGYITDAITGNTVGNVKLQVRAGVNSPDSNDVLLELSTNSSGYYEYNPKDFFGIKRGLPSGQYTVTMSKSGYIKSSFNIIVKEDEVVRNQNGTISPILKDDEYRIVLRWGSSPSDLDSHYNAIGEADHVYYSHKSGKTSSLDVDDTSSYGPETITVTGFSSLTQGFVYSVHNYSDKGSTSSTRLSNSDAYVTVYHGSYRPVVFHVPVGYTGTVWNVFKVNSSGEIEAINTFDNCSDPGNVGGAFRNY